MDWWHVRRGVEESPAWHTTAQGMGAHHHESLRIVMGTQYTHSLITEDGFTT